MTTPSYVEMILQTLPVMPNIDDITAKLTNANSICTDFLGIKVIPKEFQSFLTEDDIPSKTWIHEQIVTELKKKLQVRLMDKCYFDGTPTKIAETIHNSFNERICEVSIINILETLYEFGIVGRQYESSRHAGYSYHKKENVDVFSINTTVSNNDGAHTKIVKICMQNDIFNMRLKKLPSVEVTLPSGKVKQLYVTKDEKLIDKTDAPTKYLSFEDIRASVKTNRFKDDRNYGYGYMRKLLEDISFYGFIKPVNTHGHGICTKYESFITSL